MKGELMKWRVESQGRKGPSDEKALEQRQESRGAWGATWLSKGEGAGAEDHETRPQAGPKLDMLKEQREGRGQVIKGMETLERALGLIL